MAKSAKLVSTMCLIFRLALPSCARVMGHKQLLSISRWARNGANALNPPPLLDCKYWIQEVNLFSTKVLNLMNVAKAWSLVCKE